MKSLSELDKIREAAAIKLVDELFYARARRKEIRYSEITDEDLFRAGFDAGAKAVMDEAEELANVINLRGTNYHDDDCGDAKEKFELHESCECGASAVKQTLARWNDFRGKND